MSGDLISRSALLEALKKSRNHHANNEREHSLLCRCENIVREQPTIEAVPVVHGEWIRHKPNKAAMEEFHKMGVGKGMSVNSIYWTCSNCGNWGMPRHKYCNKCGAKMKGGAE